MAAAAILEFSLQITPGGEGGDAENQFGDSPTNITENHRVWGDPWRLVLVPIMYSYGDYLWRLHVAYASKVIV